MNRFPFRAHGIRKPHIPGTMNKTESRYADHLKAQMIAGLILWWDFEPVTLKLAKDLRYTPDFAVLNTSAEFEFHEVKAGIKQKKRDGSKEFTGKIEPRIEDDARVKIATAAEKFPFSFSLFWEDSGNWMRREF